MEGAGTAERRTWVLRGAPGSLLRGPAVAVESQRMSRGEPSKGYQEEHLKQDEQHVPRPWGAGTMDVFTKESKGCGGGGRDEKWGRGTCVSLTDDGKDAPPPLKVAGSHGRDLSGSTSL